MMDACRSYGQVRLDQPSSGVANNPAGKIKDPVIRRERDLVNLRAGSNSTGASDAPPHVRRFGQQPVLRRARSCSGHGRPAPARHQRARDPPALDRYVRTWQLADIDAFVRLAAEDICLSTPPLTAWFDGRETVAAFIEAAVFARPARTGPAGATTRRPGPPGRQPACKYSSSPTSTGSR
jgi:hypothetical protein